MSEPLIRRRSLPSSLRYLAGKLTELADAGGDPDLRGHALTLLTLADEAEQHTAVGVRNMPHALACHTAPE